MNKLCFVLLLLLSLTACKKTKLDGELSVLVGTWEWRYCVKTIDLCEPFPYDSLITSTPSTKNFTCTLVFEEKGRLIVKKNGKKVDKYKLMLFSRGEDYPNKTSYIFKTKNKKK